MLSINGEQNGRMGRSPPMTQEGSSGLLMSLSSELASAVEHAAASVVRVDDGSRLTASGIIWSADGLILTTSHGVERDEPIAIERGDGTRLNATLVGRDLDTDLAVLRVPVTNLPAAQGADPAQVKVGQLVLALGRPGTAGLQATIGIVSARMDTESNGKLGYILHTDAVLYPGFSGGALVDVSGRVVGITNLMYGRGKGVAIGTPVAQQVAETLLAHGTVPRGYLGVRTQGVALPGELRKKLNLAQERALVVLHVEAGSPAEKSGLMLGDTLLGINGEGVHDGDQLRRQLRRLAPGQTATLQILRGGEPRDLQATVAAAATMIRVLIVAAYASVRAGLQALLAEAEECAVVGAVSGSAELERLLPDARPDVVLLDDNEGDGARVLDLILASETGLVVLGDSPRGYQRLAGLPLPGWAYLLKEADGLEIAGAVRAVAVGLVALDRGLAPLLAAGAPLPPSASLREAGRPPDLASAPPLPDEVLTARELEVLQLMAAGLQNRQIAARLCISPHTVKFHVASILAKLGAASRTEAVTLGVRRGYVIL
jgi:S1-C subfamily serine protease/DNA-binding NarL/FixJ family response regulator